MSYLYGTSGWTDDLAAGISTVGKVVVNAPTHLKQAYSTAQQMGISAKTTLTNVQRTAANAAAGSSKANALADKLDAGTAQWNKAKPFVYIGGIVLLGLVVRKLV